MKLAVFDLDGTLASTFAVDVECFVQAFRDALGIDRMNTVWTDYKHVTDSGVTSEAFVTAYRRAPSHDEISRLVECFVALLEERARTSNHRFGEIPGASEFLRRLRESSEWAIAIATGSWERSARFKIGKAGLDTADCPAAFAEDGPARASILQAAIARAAARHGQQSFERIVSVGDAAWDILAARDLQLPFVGVGRGERGEKLQELGASHVVEDFLLQDDCLRAMNEAQIPDRR
jgi:phosphoglycolate phosphatase-like HAD superfamily hydrolase